MTTKVLFLDLNGTLVDDWDPAYAAICAIFTKFHLPSPTLAEYITEIAVTGDHHGFYENHGVVSTRDELYEIFILAYKKHSRETIPFPNLHSALTRMKNAGIILHLVTAARYDLAHPLVEATNISQYFTGEHYHIHHKQNAVESVLTSSGVVPEYCAMLGDLPSDIVHAKQAGIAGIAFLNKHVPKKLFSELHSMDYATPSLHDVASYMINL